MSFALARYAPRASACALRARGRVFQLSSSCSCFALPLLAFRISNLSLTNSMLSGFQNGYDLILCQKSNQSILFTQGAGSRLRPNHSWTKQSDSLRSVLGRLRSVFAAAAAARVSALARKRPCTPRAPTRHARYAQARVRGGLAPMPPGLHATGCAARSAAHRWGESHCVFAASSCRQGPGPEPSCLRNAFALAAPAASALFVHGSGAGLA
jgi:hypothetical protein